MIVQHRDLAARSPTARKTEVSKGIRSPSKVVRRLKLLPLAASRIRTWQRFMYNYALGLVPRAPYVLRNNAQIKIGRGVEHVPIIEIFLHEDYGSIPDDSVVLDLGANIGVFSVYAGTTARNVRVYAYEPSASFFLLLQENMVLNGLSDSVTCFKCAVGAESGERELYVEAVGMYFPSLVTPQGAGARRVSVPCISLSDILDGNRLNQVDLIKMDCEGAEYEILYSTPSIYFDRIREIRMEYHNLPGTGCNRDTLITFLRNLGYDVSLGRTNSTDGTNGNLWARKHA